MARLALVAALTVLAISACGGDDPDDREQVEEVTGRFFEGLVDGDCDKISESVKAQMQKLLAPLLASQPEIKEKETTR